MEIFHTSMGSEGISLRDLRGEDDTEEPPSLEGLHEGDA